MNEKTNILVSFAVPCYNVAGYVDHCVEKILAGTEGYHDRIEIILVNDGSIKDETPKLIDSWHNEHPAIIKAVHQENGGHGEAVNAGLRNARGYYFKVVDADDWLDTEATQQLMKLVVDLVDTKTHGERPVDLVIANYVYEKVYEGKRMPVRYKNVLPENCVFTWADIGKLKHYQNILMHSVMYRTDVLRAAQLELPKHTFYVDNIYVYVPLPMVQTIYYLNVDLYRYFIGREGQSVNEKIMISRIDQQLRITRIMIDAYDLEQDIAEPYLRHYMTNYLTMMITICSVFLLMSEREDALEQRDAIWAYLKEKNPGIYPTIRHGAIGKLLTLRGRFGNTLAIGGYRIARKIFKFN